jgi:hypothetical protein
MGHPAAAGATAVLKVRRPPGLLEYRDAPSYEIALPKARTALGAGLVVSTRRSAGIEAAERLVDAEIRLARGLGREIEAWVDELWARAARKQVEDIIA